MKKLLLCLTALCSLTTNGQTLIYHSNFQGNANDLSGNGLNGTVNGATLCPGQTGIPNTAYLFDGVNDYIQLPTNTLFNLKTWTLQALIKMNGFYSGNCQTNAIIWHATQNASNHYSLVISDNYYDLSCSTNSTQEAFGANAAGTSTTPDFQSPWYTSNGYVNTNTWYCLTATYDSSTISVYIDGTLVESGPWTNQYYYGVGAGTPSPTYIGKGNSTLAYPNWFNGIIDQVSIWKDAMGSQEIQHYCDSSHAGYWKSTNPSLSAEEHNINQIGRNDFNVNVFPNPANDEMTVEVNENWQGSTIYIMNGIGQIVTAVNPTSYQSKINVKKFPSGIYIVKVISGDKMSTTSKFIKE